MFLLVIFGISMLGFGLFMVSKPMQFSNGIAQFSQKPWFHVFEIFSRFVVGILFLLLANATPYPVFFTWLGSIFCLVSVILVIIGAERHKKFARLTSGIGHKFRMLGVGAILCGAGLVYVGLI